MSEANPGSLPGPPPPAGPKTGAKAGSANRWPLSRTVGVAVLALLLFSVALGCRADRL
jgi:hypothetical protein